MVYPSSVVHITSICNAVFGFIRYLTCQHKHARKVRRLIILAAVILAAILIPTISSAQQQTGVTSTAPARYINLVFDDSGSMVRESREYHGRWAQAKYAIEVFSALLEEGDVLNIYAMSDFCAETSSGPPRLIVRGDEGLQQRVSRVHEMVVTVGRTPFGSVLAAREGLESAPDDAKRWLVVFTDGMFQTPAVGDVDFSEAQNVRRELLSYTEDDISVMFFTMGEYSPSLGASEGRLFVREAVTDDDILHHVTEMGAQIFEKSQIVLDGTKFTSDVALRELTVFAQGTGVEINEIAGADATFSSRESTKVRYSTLIDFGGRDFDEARVDATIPRDLQGELAIFSDLPAGDFNINVSNASQVSLFYVPDVQASVRFFNEQGEQLLDPETFVGGEYRVEFGLVDGSAVNPLEAPFIQSQLLGEVTGFATLVNNGNIISGPSGYEIQSGEIVYIEEGELTGTASLTYLRYNTATAEFFYEILQPPIPLDFTVLSIPNFEASSLNTDRNEGILVKVSHEGELLSPELWTLVSSETRVSLLEGDEGFYFEVAKGTEDSTIIIYPRYQEHGFFTHPGGPAAIRLFVDVTESESHYRGQSDAILFDVSLDIRYWGPPLLILLIIIWWLIGYLPFGNPFGKSYMPRDLKKRPLIKVAGRPSANYHGSKRKLRWGRRFWPYRNDIAEVNFVDSLSGIPNLLVKARKGKELEVLNTDSYIGFMRGHKMVRFGPTIDLCPDEPNKSKENLIICTSNTITSRFGTKQERHVCRLDTD